VPPAKRLSTLYDVHLYCITTPPANPAAEPAAVEAHYKNMVAAACAGGADAVQLREKTLPARRLAALCKDLQAICDKAGALFILNDRVDVAVAADVDGVHVGQDDLPVRAVRQILGHRKILGCSAHSVAQAFQAQGDGADYVSCGPVFATPTKPDYPPVGLDLVRQYKALVKIPFVAIGGIEAGNVDRVIAAGADRVAVVRAVCGAPDVESVARELKEKVLAAKRERQASVHSGAA
jgi:thiamine-phosphate pyrophosphorylase